MSDNNDPAGAGGAPSDEKAFTERDDALTKALDKLEREVRPPKPKPAPIGGMF